MRTLLDEALDARDLITWSTDRYYDVKRLIELGKCQEAIKLADSYIDSKFHCLDRKNMITLLDKAVDLKHTIIWSDRCWCNVDDLIECGEYQEAIDLANKYTDQESARKNAMTLLEKAIDASETMVHFHKVCHPNYDYGLVGRGSTQEHYALLGACLDRGHACRRDVDKLIQDGKYEDAIKLANDHVDREIELERVRRECEKNFN